MFGTTAPDSTQNTRATFSEHFSGFTLLKNLKAPESGWRLFNALSASTEAGFGPRQSARGRAQHRVVLKRKSRTCGLLVTHEEGAGKNIRCCGASDLGLDLIRLPQW